METVTEIVQPLRCMLAKLMIQNNSDVDPEVIEFMADVYDHNRKALRYAIRKELEKASMN